MMGGISLVESTVILGLRFVWLLLTYELGKLDPAKPVPSEAVKENEGMQRGYKDVNYLCLLGVLSQRLANADREQGLPGHRKGNSH